MSGASCIMAGGRGRKDCLPWVFGLPRRDYVCMYVWLPCTQRRPRDITNGGPPDELVTPSCYTDNTMVAAVTRYVQYLLCGTSRSMHRIKTTRQHITTWQEVLHSTIMMTTSTTKPYVTTATVRTLCSTTTMRRDDEASVSNCYVNHAFPRLHQYFHTTTAGCRTKCSQ